MKNKKILIVRFSSIGDIVLTTPVIRCIKKQSEQTEIHYLTKKSYKELLEHNPYLDKIITIDKNISEVVAELKHENYDLIIDLHNNLRTFFLKIQLRKPCVSFRKLNLKKWLYVNFKINLLRQSSVVERYMETVKRYGIAYDGKGLNYFLKEDSDVLKKFNINKTFIAFVIGAKFATKSLPEEKIIAVCSNSPAQIILIGGKEDREKGNRISEQTHGKCVNLCGQLSLNESAAVLKESTLVIANDTGFMHIATAFNKPLISVWGSTTPELGFAPFYPVDKKNLSFIVQAENVSCRPCSKIGYQHCPKKHFNCMNGIKEERIVRLVKEIMSPEKS